MNGSGKSTYFVTDLKRKIVSFSIEHDAERYLLVGAFSEGWGGLYIHPMPLKN